MENPRHDKKLMSAAAAAELMGVTRQRIHQLVREGRLTGLWDRTYLYVPRAQVEALIGTRGKRAVPEGMLTKHDVAERFGVSPRTVQHWYQNGHLPGTVAPSGVLVFEPKEVNAFQRPPRGRPPQ